MEPIEKIIESLANNIFNIRTLTIFLLSLVAAYLLSRLVGFGIKKFAHFLDRYGDNAQTPERVIQFRRAETYLNVAITFTRFAIFGLAVFIAWQLAMPEASPLTVIGASTIFFVLAGATISPILRDITAGIAMIAEKWYNVGDFITIDPYYEESGVVERMNLRSTRVRKLNGEIMWVHNQYIQRVSVTPKGVRTMAIDIFVNDMKKSEDLINHLKNIMNVGPTMLTKPLEVAYSQKLSDDIWQITVIGVTAPGREWLLEKFAIDMMKRFDEKQPKKIMIYEPIARWADPIAEKRFKRAVRAKVESAVK